ncbi:MAG: sigma-54-dependent transcriptional regulator [Desulfobacca sp.]|uniref:sigma-54-dependent transcriptional regulator n=1 Tax=Desulfobacca sp. TaxID=2067990 RepID=UPI004049CF73
MPAGSVLIIDDEPVIGLVCRLVLEEQDYQVEVCQTGREGLEKLRTGDYDVALLDFKLPDLEGMEILRTIQQERLGPSTIVMTAFSTVENAVAAMKAGAFDYLAKPFTDDELLITVSKAVEKKRLVEENLALRQQLVETYGFSNIIGENAAMQKIFVEISKVAPTDTTVLICGEPGTGKELFARAIHTYSRRASHQFVPIDCSTLSPTLLESELFGHVKGAFTGASKDKPGIFAVAHKGTLFLDEVANLSLEIQGKLLRVLETHDYKPVGASQMQKTDARVLAATSKDLKAMVQEGTFRDDLYYRLNVFPIYLPPLRARQDDIPRLAYHFLRHFSRKIGKPLEGFTPEALEMLVGYPWPGNVRQLKNLIERLVIMVDHPLLDGVDLLEHLDRKGWGGEGIPETLQELKEAKKRLLAETYGRLEKAFLLKALRAADHNITAAARRVGMQRSNFSVLLKKHRLSPERRES